MKVAHILWSLTYGGIETMLVNIANEQIKLGCEVHIVIINDIIDETLFHTLDEKIQIHRIGRKRHDKNMLFVVKLTRLLKRINPDAIHLHNSHIYDMIFSQRLSRVASTTLHDLPSGKVRRGGIYRLSSILDWFSPGNTAYLDRIPRVFAISQAVHDELQSKYGVESKVIYNGIPTSKFEQRPIGDLTDGKMRIVQVSRLEHDKKGQDLLIEAVARMDDGVHVDFIGDGNSREYLDKLAKRLGVEHRITFHGTLPQDYVASHLHDYDLFVQPSRYEGFGLTVAEAMAAQVPVLVSAGQGPAEVTCGDTYGWTFENGNIKDLVDKIEYIRTHYDGALYKVEKARQHVVNNYDVSVTAKSYIDNYLK